MSRQRVVTGVDERGRPRTEWSEARSGDERLYGHMEPAHVPTIERRQATPEELAARLDDEVMSPIAPRPFRRETVVAEAAQILTNGSPPADVDCGGPLATLADAVGAACEAWVEKGRAEQLLDQADIAWLAARRTLDAAYRALNGPTPLPVVVPPAKAARSVEPKRRRPGGGDSRDRAIAENAVRVLEVLARHGGNTKEAGLELGLRGNVVGRIARAARDRAAASTTQAAEQ